MGKKPSVRKGGQTTRGKHEGEDAQPEFRSKVSGGGGEEDVHHTHEPALKGKGARRKRS
jgi:hypothetical protein